MNLNEAPDTQLISLIKEESDSDAYLELKKRVEKCYYRTCESYCKKVPQLKYHELIEDVDFLLTKSINSYDQSKKTKFSSWVTNYSRFHVLNTIKSNTELAHFIPHENKDIDFLNESNYNIHKDEDSTLKEYVFTTLNKLGDSRINDIFNMRFYGDKNTRKWKNISSKLNLSTQQVTNLFNKGRNYLYKEMAKE